MTRFIIRKWNFAFGQKLKKDQIYKRDSNLLVWRIILCVAPTNNKTFIKANFNFQGNLWIFCWRYSCGHRITPITSKYKGPTNTQWYLLCYPKIFHPILSLTLSKSFIPKPVSISFSVLFKIYSSPRIIFRHLYSIRKVQTTLERRIG